jgi:hypothetical protein
MGMSFDPWAASVAAVDHLRNAEIREGTIVLDRQQG